LIEVTSQAPKPKRLGTTSYTVLGLLALRDWTTYELAVQMERGIGRMWSAAPSMVYEEPKHLVAYGFAKVRQARTGRRAKSVYSITSAGRKALAQWLEEPGAPPALQFEALLKVLFSDQGSTEDLLATLQSLHEWAGEAIATARTRGRLYEEGDYIEGVALESRASIVALTLPFLNDFYHLVADWSAWAAARATDDQSDTADVFHAVAGGRRVIPRRGRIGSMNVGEGE
jgi:DNA-binding PadR family transcriptional regulator